MPSDKPSEEAWTVFNKTNSALTDNNAIKLLIEPNGMKWIGTERGGLINYDDEKWEIYQTENSNIPHNSIYAIVIDKNKNKWIANSITNIGQSSKKRDKSMFRIKV